MLFYSEFNFFREFLPYSLNANAPARRIRWTVIAVTIPNDKKIQLLFKYATGGNMPIIHI